ncbi:MAG: efflux RND transporter periplasmic adaptor subunit [Patescibacteria group bacterium]|nr:efflux RND transporter periplasmic adaptor subunit [Patescibacteria group bacterium]
MTNYLSKFMTRRVVVWTAVALVAMSGAWMLVSARQSGPEAVIVVQPGDFVEQVSIAGAVKAAHEVNLGFEQSGRVSAVHASVGQVVGAGAPLASLSSGDLSASVAQKEATLAMQEAKLEGLKVGARTEDIQVAEAQAAKAAQDLVNMYASAIDTIASAYTKADDAVRTQLTAFFSNADTDPQLTFSSSDSQAVTDIKTKRYNAGKELDAWAGDIYMLTATTDSEALDAALARASLHLARIKDFLNVAARVAQDAITTPPGVSSTDTLKASVTTAATAVNAALSSVNTSAQNIAAQKITVQQLEAALALKRAGASAQDIMAQEASVAAASADLQSARVQLAKTVLRAPFSGTVTNMDAKVGQIVSPNTPVVSMISNGVFEIESFIPEVDIAQIELGDSASTTLDAYGPDVYFTARVIAIDPAQTTVNGVSTYKTTLQFTKADPRIRSGMTANVIITTQNIPDTISVPRGAVFTKSGISYVQVREEDAIVDRAVETGESSPIGNIRIISGLNSGDVVLLNPDSTR